MLAGVLISSRIEKLLLGLLRSIHLREPSSPHRAAQFFVGLGGPDRPMGCGVAIKWWKTARAQRLSHALARATRDHLLGRVRLDHEAAIDAIESALKNNTLNTRLLNFYSKAEASDTLFDAYAPAAAPEITDVLWRAILAALDSVVDEWLFVYPLRMLTSDTRQFSEINAHIVATSDTATFSQYCADFSGLRQLSLQSGRIEGMLTMSDDNTPAWLMVRVRGTNTVAWAEGARIASMFLGALLSAHSMDRPYHAFAASSARTNSYAAIFSRSCKHTSSQARASGVLLHAVVSGTNISTQVLDQTDAWLKKVHGANAELRRRAFLAARWINQAAAADRHVRFLFFFFALDALFGERFRVEERIIAGIGPRFTDSVWEQKCRWLFELRSELVHGGAASIEEWGRFERYRTHFESKPLNDVEQLAVQSLMRFFG
jgi:hypothetical protein